MMAIKIITLIAMCAITVAGIYIFYRQMVSYDIDGEREPMPGVFWFYVGYVIFMLLLLGVPILLL